jgi:hypothetical protein
VRILQPGVVVKEERFPLQFQFHAKGLATVVAEFLSSLRHPISGSKISLLLIGWYQTLDRPGSFALVHLINIGGHETTSCLGGKLSSWASRDACKEKELSV